MVCYYLNSQFQGQRVNSKTVARDDFSVSNTGLHGPSHTFTLGLKTKKNILFCRMEWQRSKNSSVTTVTRRQTIPSGNRNSNPHSVGCPLLQTSTSIWVPSSPPVQSVTRFRGIKVAGTWYWPANHCVQVNSNWIYTTTHLLCLYWMQRTLLPIFCPFKHSIWCTSF